MGCCDRIRCGHSQARLEDLISERSRPGADRGAIDARIWDLFGERWAVMFTDLSGFSRHVAEFGITHFLQVIHESHRLLVPVIETHDGILVKLEGDSMLVMFRSPTKALECALAMQHALVSYNEEREASEKVLLCVGIGYGDVLRIGDEDVYGCEVNAASKLGEDTAGAGETLVTTGLRDAVESLPNVAFEPLAAVPPGASGAFRAVLRD